MSAARGLCAGLFLLGCTPQAAEKPRTFEPDVRRFVHQAFAITEEVTCQVDDARRVLTEARDRTGPSEDILALEVSLACQTRTGARAAELPSLDAALIQLVDEAGAVHATSTRTKLSALDPSRLVFELSTPRDVVPRPRRYALATGKREGGRETDVGSLRIGLPDRRIEIRLREAERGPAFDAFLDGFAARLASPEAANGVLGETQRLVRVLRDKLGPHSLVLLAVEETQDGLALALALEGSALRDLPDAVARFTVRIRHTGESFALTGVMQPEETTERAACAEDLARLAGRAEQAFQEKPSGQGTCNALGLLLPGACDQTDHTLLDAALAIRARCVALPALAGQAGTVPADFQLTLRRGQQGTGLDRTPRYVLSLFAEGQVVFHGRHWVSDTGRSDGRTTPRVLSALYERLRALDFFARRGGVWDPDRCGPDDELGNLLTLHAEGKERMVVDREGCRGPFSRDELARLIDVIEGAAGVPAWTTPMPRYVTQNVQVWTIPAE